MFTFIKTDEGFQVHTKDGRGVATIDCGRIEFDHNPKYKNPQPVMNKYDRTNWVIHFAGCRLNPLQLDAFCDELRKQEF